MGHHVVHHRRPNPELHAAADTDSWAWEGPVVAQWEPSECGAEDLEAICRDVEQGDVVGPAPVLP